MTARSLGLPLAAAALLSAVALQAARDRLYPREEADVQRIIYIRSGEVMKRLTLSYDALAADVYWVRAMQHYGGDRLDRKRPRRRYDLLYPLLDLTTTLDPYFNIAYRFGAIFLSEPYPGGPGRPDQAVALLRKGLAVQPTRWQYYHDTAFVYFWHLRDYAAAAAWFQRGASQPNAPTWLAPVAATMLAKGGDRTSARFLWHQILGSDQPWLRNTAARALLQLEAMDWIDRLEGDIRKHSLPPGESYTWPALQRRGIVATAPPLDPSDTPFEIDPVTGDVTVSLRSPLYPLPDQERQPSR